MNIGLRSRGKFAELSMRDWEPIGAGGESGYTAGDPQHPGIIFGGTGQRWDLESNIAMRGTAEPAVPEGETARTDWTQPLVLSKADTKGATVTATLQLAVCGMASSLAAVTVTA